VRVLRLLVGLVVVGLLAGGLTVTVVRVLQPDSAVAVGLAALAPLALAAYAVVVVLVVVPAVRRSGPALLALVVALVGVALHGWWLAPLYTGPAASAAAGERLVVMSANVEGVSGDDAVAVVRAASARGVDLLALLEVSPQALASMDDGGLARAFPHRVGGDDGIPRTVLLSRTRLGLETRLASVDGLVADVTLGDGSARVLVAHPVQPLSDAEQWRRDHATVLDAARRDVDLVLGDLNATLDHAPLRALVDAGFHDATERTNRGWQPTWPIDGGLPFPVVQIDHVLVGERVDALDTDTVRLAGTDHAAVLAEVAFK
jgi:hypothetical protein